jgi:hypothetical protein
MALETREQLFLNVFISFNLLLFCFDLTVNNEIFVRYKLYLYTTTNFNVSFFGFRVWSFSQPKQNYLGDIKRWYTLPLDFYGAL